MTRPRLIDRESKKNRGIKLRTNPFGIPIMGTISSGAPIEVFSDPVDPLELGRDLEQPGAYALVVKGQSLIEDHICENDFVVIKPQSTCVNGDLVVAVLMQGNGKATLKRFFSVDEKIYLQSANYETPPMCIPIGEWQTDWQVQGKVIALVRKEIDPKSENISKVLYALRAGAKVITEEKKHQVKDERKDAYEKLTRLVNSKLAGKPGNESLVDKYQNQPESWSEKLRNELVQVAVDQDNDIIKAANDFENHMIQGNIVYDRIVTAHNTTQDRLDQIVDQCSKEAKQWFLYSLGAATLGFLVILGGVVLAVFTVNVSLGFLTSLASIFPNIVSFLFFQQRNKANERLDRFKQQLDNTADIYKAAELTLTTSKETQDQFKELIIKKWLGLDK